MDLIIQKKENTLILVPDGILDEQGAEELCKAVIERDAQYINVTVDGTLMFGLNQEGLAALVRLCETVKAQGGRFLLRRLGDHILTMLELTELVYYFEIEN